MNTIAHEHMFIAQTAKYVASDTPPEENPCCIWSYKGDQDGHTNISSNSISKTSRVLKISLIDASCYKSSKEMSHV